MDIASQEDNRGVHLDEVGVTGVKIPIRVLDKNEAREYQYTIGTFDAFVMLPDDQRGTHMSRIVEIIYKNRKDINARGMHNAAEELANRLDARCSRIRVTFPYFVDVSSPVSKLQNSMVYQARFDMRYEEVDCQVRSLRTFEQPAGKITDCVWDFRLGVDVDVMTVCPCALEECQTGASHVQRGQIKIDVKPEEAAMIWLEDLIDVAEKSGSSPVYERLKRVDESYVVNSGFNNPQFVEDVVRDAALRARELSIKAYRISCENFESIHQHNAYAKKEWKW